MRRAQHRTVNDQLLALARGFTAASLTPVETVAVETAPRASALVGLGVA